MQLRRLRKRTETAKERREGGESETPRERGEASHGEAAHKNWKTTLRQTERNSQNNTRERDTHSGMERVCF